MAGGWENQSGKWRIDLDINSCTFKGKTTYSYLSHIIRTWDAAACPFFAKHFSCIYNTSFEFPRNVQKN